MKTFIVKDQDMGARRGGFTLLQVLLVIGLISMLSAVLVGQFGRGRAAVRRAECDVHLKEIVLAIDTFRQETGKMPARLMDLQTGGYLPMTTMLCPADPTSQSAREAGNGQGQAYSSYSDFYVLRDALDNGNLPLVVCPLHEKDGGHGAQAFKGGYTKTYGAKPAILSGIEGAVTVTRPGEGVLSIPDSKQLEVRGGDRIQLGSGNATLTFVDGSVASLTAGSEMSVLESYLESQDKNSIYTLVRQFAGTINYSIVPGNKFDVATPTATAGALGTKFSIQLVGDEETSRTPKLKITVLTVTEHIVALTTGGRTIEVAEKEPAVWSNDASNRRKERKPRGIKKTKKQED